MTTCVACGRSTYSRRAARCNECVRLGLWHPSLVCVCPVPCPELVHLFGRIPLADAYECRRCRRKAVR